MNVLRLALARQNEGRPPVWLMRQAGRYHSHYQAIKKKHSFIELCKNPKLACEVTMGPIRDFDFDAAILFSDILFPLEAMGMGLAYEVGPKLEWHLREPEDLVGLSGGKSDSKSLIKKLEFQADAMRAIRKELPREKGLIGFVGAPLTLFFYAVEGSHQGDLASAKIGMRDGRYLGFCDKLVPLLAENMILQAKAGADAIALFDTCGGDVDPKTYRDLVIPTLKGTIASFRAQCPDTPIIYYSKRTTSDYWIHLKELPIQCMGIDWNHPIEDVLKAWSGSFAIQGNVDPHWLLLDPSELEQRLRSTFERVRSLPREYLKGWVCGLGHGVLKETPEENVRLFVRLQREIFSK